MRKTAVFFLASLVLFGRLHAAGATQSLREFPEIEFASELGRDLHPMPPGPYDPETQHIYDLGNQRRLRVRKRAGLKATSAKDEIDARITLLRKYLAKQIDPYRGEASVKSACDIPENASAHRRETPKEIAQPVVLVVSPAFAVDCYGTAADRGIDHRLILFCKETETLFEVDIFDPVTRKNPPTVPIAHCRAR